jgi:5-methyltetrahydropteroyltriglutamate--homocysteine methyltransferase
MALPSTIVGSLPRPSWLATPGEVFTSWRLDGPQLAEGQDDAVVLAVADQHDAGLDILTDGEQRRRHYIWGFCEGLTGFDFRRLVKISSRAGRYRAQTPAPRVTAPVRRPRPVTLNALRFLKARTNRPVKVNLPGPMTITDSVADECYGSRRRLAFELAKVLNDEAIELAEAGCDIVQFDEPCFNIYLDEVEEWGIAALEEAARGVRAGEFAGAGGAGGAGGSRTAVHICYGYGIPAVLAWKHTNTDWTHYHRTLPLLEDSNIDQISVECAASGVDPSVLGLAPSKDLMVGVIDVGSEDVETAEDVAGRIRIALRYVSPERLYSCTDCGLMPRSRRSARGKMQALVEGANIVRADLI